MDLITFLSHSDITALGNKFCFVTSRSSYALSMLIKKKYKQNFERVSCIDSTDNEASFKAHLEMAFLGTQTCYWLSAEVLNTTSLFSYIKNYQGPNVLVFFASQEVAKKIAATDIEIPAAVTYDLFMQLFVHCYGAKAHTYKTVVHKIVNMQTTISLEHALLIMDYCMLVGSKAEAFIASWLPSLIVPEKSLFTLSTYFFAKKKQQFFQVWHAIADEYAEVFWTTYWSEQLFKASTYITLMQEKNFIQAKKAAYRLPFSFIQKDWKGLTVEELSQAHDHIYSLDWNIKNGLNAHLEHFYLQFMCK